jgi:hypothetical protein
MLQELHKQCQADFPTIEDWRDPERMEARRIYIEKLCPHPHRIVLAKLSEYMTDEWPLDVLGWMYCVHPPYQRAEIIKGYKKIIKGINNGTIRRTQKGILEYAQNLNTL